MPRTNCVRRWPPSRPRHSAPGPPPFRPPTHPPPTAAASGVRARTGRKPPSCTPLPRGPRASSEQLLDQARLDSAEHCPWNPSTWPISSTAGRARLRGQRGAQVPEDFHRGGKLPGTRQHRRPGHPVGNLVDDAVRYTPAHGHIAVSCGLDHRTPVLAIADDVGPACRPQAAIVSMTAFSAHRQRRARSRHRPVAGCPHRAATHAELVEIPAPRGFLPDHSVPPLDPDSGSPWSHRTWPEPPRSACHSSALFRAAMRRGDRRNYLLSHRSGSMDSRGRDAMVLARPPASPPKAPVVRPPAAPMDFRSRGRIHEDRYSESCWRSATWPAMARPCRCCAAGIGALFRLEEPARR